MSGRFIPLALFGALLIVLIIALRQNQFPVTNDPMVGRKLPVLALPALDEKSTSFTGQNNPDGKLRLVNFFASWCTSCAAEHPLLLELAQHSAIVVDGIAWKDSQEKTQAWLKTHGNPYRHVGLDEHGKAAVDFGLRGVPESYLVDDTGTILWHVSGPLTKNAVQEITRIAGKLK